jgi:hypothetical protein
LREPHLGIDDVGELADLLRGHLALALRVLVEAGVRTLLHHLAQLTILGLCDKDPGRIRADIDGGTEHASIMSDPEDDDRGSGAR